MTIDDYGQAAVLMVGILTVLCNAPIIAVQLTEFVRYWRSGDSVQPYRLVVVSILLQATVILIWRLLIWMDVNFADGHWLGRTAMRWRLDLAVGLICQGLVSYPAYIFWRDRLQGIRSRRQAKASTAPPKGV